MDGARDDDSNVVASADQLDRKNASTVSADGDVAVDTNVSLPPTFTSDTMNPPLNTVTPLMENTTSRTLFGATPPRVPRPVDTPLDSDSSFGSFSMLSEEATCKLHWTNSLDSDVLDL